MKIINRLVIIILISISILLINTINYKIYCAYQWEPKGTKMITSDSSWRSEFYCVNHSYEMNDSKSHTFYLTNRVNYYSDDTSEFRQKIGYLFYLASQDQNAQKSISYDKNKDGSIYRTYIKLNGYRGTLSGYQRTKYQLVLWKLLKDFSNNTSSCVNGEAPLYLTKVNDVSGAEWNQDAQNLYNKIINDYNNNNIVRSCTAHVGIDHSELQVDNDNSREVDFGSENPKKYAHFKINSLSGTISDISITVNGIGKKTITSEYYSNGQVSLFRKTKNNGKYILQSVKVKNIKSGDVVYIKVNTTDGASSITKINGNLTCEGNKGWVVNLEKWTNYTGGKHNNFEQSFIRVVVWNNRSNNTGEFNIETKTGSLQIGKLGVEDWIKDGDKYKTTKPTTSLKASFKIYCVDKKQWLVGTAGGSKSYTDDYDQASIYRTSNQVGSENWREVTIKNLIAGYKYRFYEIDVNNSQFKDSNGIPRIIDVSWKDPKENVWHRNLKNYVLAGEVKEYPGFGDVSVEYNTTKTIDVRNKKVDREEIEIGIKKEDSSTKQGLQGVGLQLYKKDVGWVAIDDEDGSTFFAEEYPIAATFITGQDGKISVKDLTVGTYYIYEKKASPAYSLNHQRTKYPDGNDPNKFAGKDEYSNIVYLGTKTLVDKDKGTTIDNITYKQYALNTELTISKKDGILDRVLSGTKMKIYGKTTANLNGWINKTDDGEYKFGTYEKATEFATDNNGEIKLEKILYGTYYIFETEVADKNNYNIKEQPGYHKNTDENGNIIPGTSELLDDKDWVYLGVTKISESSTSNIFNYTAINYPKVDSLKGKVWIDHPDGKLNGYNNIYDGQDWTIQNEPISKDELKKDITVNLYSNKDGKNGLIATTTTGENGEYEFKTKANGEKFTYWELAYCYVEFVYDNKEYITVTPFEGENVEINSKAQEKEIISTGGQNNMGELYDENLTGLDPNGAFPGKAITYQAQASEINVDTIKNNQNAPQNQRLLTSYYNSDTHTIENINLGLIKKLEPSFSVGQQIEYVKIKRGNYTFKYKMRRKICNRYGRWN